MKLLPTILFFFLLLTKAMGQGRPEMNIEIIKAKLDIAKEDTSKVQLLNNLAFSYAFIYADSATSIASEALMLSRKIKYPEGEAQSLSILSLSLTILGNFPAALHYSFDGLALSEKINSTSLIIDALNNLQTCYRDQEDYTEALQYGFRALKIANLPGVEPYQKFLTLGFLSSVYEKMGQPDSAFIFGHLAKQLNSFPWGGLYLTMGNVYSQKNKPDSAEYYYRAGISIANASMVYIDLVDIYNKMSIIKEKMNSLDSSLYYAHKSMQVEGISNYPEGGLRAASQLAHIYELEANRDSVIKYLKLSVALKNNLLNRQKIRDAQSFAFNEKLYKQKLATQAQVTRSKIKTYILTAFILGSLLIAFFLLRSNRQKQKANAVLQDKNEKIQNTLSTLKSTQTQLIQSEKMASLGELTAGIAHEIQNPLNFVNNFSDVSKELLDEMKTELDLGNTGEAKEIANDVIQNLEKINHHGKRAADIVKGMLQHSRSSSGVKEPTDINALCDEYLRLSYHGLRAKDKSFNATIKTDFDNSIGNINIIPQDIGRVILNLLTNAFYAVNEKQKLNILNYEPTVTIKTTQNPLSGGRGAEIIVTDNGNGIPEKILDKIFQPFFTTKPTGQGTGLGLSLSYDIVKAHGGELQIHNKEGEGAEFVIQLPIA